LLQKEVGVSEVEILARVERRRKWRIEEKAALIAEVEAEGGKVKLVAQRHRISESLLYNWRAAWKAAAVAAAGSSGAVEFVPLGVVGAADTAAPALRPPPEPPSSQRHAEAKAGAIEIALPDGSRVCVDAFVNEKALSRVLRAMKGAA
jgi:transposase